MVMSTNSKRETGRKAQLANIQAAKVPLLIEMPSAFSLFYLAKFIS